MMELKINFLQKTKRFWVVFSGAWWVDDRLPPECWRQLFNWKRARLRLQFRLLRLLKKVVSDLRGRCLKLVSRFWFKPLCWWSSSQRIVYVGRKVFPWAYNSLSGALSGSQYSCWYWYCSCYLLIVICSVSIRSVISEHLCPESFLDFSSWGWLSFRSYWEFWLCFSTIGGGSWNCIFVIFSIVSVPNDGKIPIIRWRDGKPKNIFFTFHPTRIIK